MVKYITVVYMGGRIRCKVDGLRQIFVTNQNWPTSRHTILHKWILRFHLLFKAMVILYMSVALFFILFPVVMYLFTGQKVVLFPIFLPMVDETTNQGFLTVSSVHLLWIVQTSMGLLGSDSLFALMLLHILPMSELFVVCIEEMNDALKTNPLVGRTEYMAMWLRNILQIHQELTG